MITEIIDRFGQRLVIVLFFALIAAPALAMLLGPRSEFSYAEKRILEPLPALPRQPAEIGPFFAGLDRYLNDHFGFREWMIYRYQRELHKRFGPSQAVTRVLEGVDHWYFNTDNRLLEDYTGRNLLPDEDLDRWLRDYREKRAWLAARGVRYLFVVPPNKQTIYGDYLGEPLTGHRGPRRFAQIAGALSAEDREVLVDPAPALLQARDREPLFFKSDTHWTPPGAYLAYRAIAEKIEALFPGVEFTEDFNFTGLRTRTCDSVNSKCGDLTTMLLDFDTFQESYRDLEPFAGCADKTPLDFLPNGVERPDATRYFRTSCPSARLKALIFFDSFFVAVEPYLSENFREAIYLLKEYDRKDVEMLLETFKPDIIIEERVERHLW